MPSADLSLPLSLPASLSPSPPPLSPRSAAYLFFVTVWWACGHGFLALISVLSLVAVDMWWLPQPIDAPDAKIGCVEKMNQEQVLLLLLLLLLLLFMVHVVGVVRQVPPLFTHTLPIASRHRAPPWAKPGPIFSAVLRTVLHLLMSTDARFGQGRQQCKQQSRGWAVGQNIDRRASV